MHPGTKRLKKAYRERGTGQGLRAFARDLVFLDNRELWNDGYDWRSRKGMNVIPF